MDEPGAYAAALRRALPPFFEPLEVAERLPTTMARAAELAAAGAPEGATVVVEEQTAGRGRLGRTWVAPPGSALLVSVVLRPALLGRSAWLVASLAGVALVDAVVEVLGGRGGPGGPGVPGVPGRPGRGRPAEVGLKWPNDLLIDGRKAAGLLAEAEAGAGPGRLGWVLLGMGVNVNQAAGDFPPEVAARATSVALAAGGPVDRAGLLGAWGERFAAGYRELAAGSTGPLLAAYRDRLDTLGRRVRADRLGAEPLEGTAVDLTPNGELVVLTGSGARVPVATADVEHLRALPAG